ncbi:MAG: hypothetical protein IJV27_04990 [Prevotella sp.]|nr:hypothetical protein [Prevotella sp.]
MNPDYKPLLNELRVPLKEYGINADDLGMKTLNKCKPILAAIESIKAERKAAENTLLSLEITFKSVADRTGIDRKSLAENEIYRHIIESVKTTREARTDKRIAALSLQLEQYKKMESDIGAIKEHQMDLNRKYATAEQDKADLRREWDVTKDCLQQANEKIEKLEKENMNLRHTLEAYQGAYGPKGN